MPNSESKNLQFESWIHPHTCKPWQLDSQVQCDDDRVRPEGVAVLKVLEMKHSYQYTPQ